MIRWTQEELAFMREWDRQVERDAAPKRSPEGKARAKARDAARHRAHYAAKITEKQEAGTEWIARRLRMFIGF